MFFRPSSPLSCPRDPVPRRTLFDRSIAWLARLLLAAAVTGCVGDPAAPAADDAADDATAPLLPDGTVGSDRVVSHGQVIDLPWIVRDGRKQIEDDWDLGPALAGPQPLSAVAVPLNPWTDGEVPYCIHTLAGGYADGLDATEAADLAGWLDDLGDITPLHFKKYGCTSSSLPTRYIDYRHWDTSYSETSKGMGHTGTTIRLSPTFGAGTVWHETGHALGFMHEQRRHDRGYWVNYYPSCLADPTHDSQFVQSTDAATDRLTPYDVHSIMEYGSGGFSVDGALCPTLLYDPDTDQNQNNDAGHAPYYGTYNGQDLYGTWIGHAGKDSLEDLNAIYQVYEPKLGTCEQGDHFGGAVAAGDFDGDGYVDLAVAATSEAPGSTAPASGVVFLYKGTMNGLTAWKILRETDFAGAAPQASDGFGRAMVAADIDGDGDDDLFIGAPRYGSPRGGAVFPYLGGRGGPAPGPGWLTQTNTGAGGTETGDDFGAALAVGAFAGGSTRYLAVGAPGEDLGGITDRGVVSVLRHTGGGAFTSWQTLSAVAPHDGDQFGYSLAAVEINGGADDLFVGAPQGPAAGTGFVTPFFGAATAMVAGASFTHSAPAAGDRFGSAMDSGLTYFAGNTEVVIGAPGRNSGRGRVYRFEASGSGTATTMVQTGDLVQADIPGESGASGDGFGSTIALADVDGDLFDEILVGAPGKTEGGASNAGAVFVYSTYGTSHVMKASSPQAQDGYGTAFAAGNFNGGYQSVVSDSVDDLAIGVPGRACSGASSAGVANVYKGPNDGLWRQLTEEITGGP
jgi:Astacin (Peptidase family M12A)/FG-GAP repeat